MIGVKRWLRIELQGVARRVRGIRPPAEDADQAERVAVLKAEHERRNVGTRDDEIIIRDGVTLSIHPDSRVPFEYFCFRSPAMVSEIDCFIHHTRGRKKLLDVGALHGVFSLVFVAGAPDREAVAVDASPVAFAKLLYNIHRNRASNVTPVECAVSDSAGSLRMHYEWEHAVASSGEAAGRTYVSVAKESGDAVCDRLAFRPDVIKIDVEGHEVKVLRGLKETITRDKPLIFLEVHPSRIGLDGDSMADLIAVLDALAYSAEEVGGGRIPIADFAGFGEERRLVMSPR